MIIGIESFTAGYGIYNLKIELSGSEVFDTDTYALNYPQPQQYNGPGGTYYPGTQNQYQSNPEQPPQESNDGNSNEGGETCFLPKTSCP